MSDCASVQKTEQIEVKYFNHKSHCESEISSDI